MSVDPDQVFARVDEQRESGELADRVTSSSVKYQSSPAHPGLIERINADGSRDLGTFKAGRFTPTSRLD